MRELALRTKLEPPFGNHRLQTLGDLVKSDIFGQNEGYKLIEGHRRVLMSSHRACRKRFLEGGSFFNLQLELFAYS